MGYVEFGAEAKLVDAGVDWITCTAKEVETCEEIVRIGQETLEHKEASGFFGRKQGFQGYLGYGVEGCFYGTRADGACLRVSGSTAHRLAGDIAQFPVHVSRLDLQLTVQFDGDESTQAEILVREYRREHRGEAGATKRRSQHIDTGDDGSSANFGKRTAAWFGRVYDKSRESDGAYPVGTWRVESECKRKLGDACFDTLKEHGFSRESIIGLIKSQWRKRDLLIMVPSSLGVEEPIVPRVTTDVERKLAWLRKTVQPVVRELHQAGYHQEATEALYSWLLTDGV